MGQGEDRPAARPRIALFAKAPQPGRVKTRLAAGLPGPLPHAQLWAARFHQHFVSSFLSRLAATPFVDRADWELHLDIWTDVFPSWPVTRRRQVSGGLGEKMLAAFEGRSEPIGEDLSCRVGEGAGAALGSERVQVILGTDAPTLPVGHIEDLLAGSADVALGPAEDGGYWGIRAWRTHPAMFANVRWSSPQALADTRAACEACGLTVEMGLPWYDIDTAEDLERLRREGFPLPDGA